MRTPLVAILLASLVSAGQSSPLVPLHVVDAGMLAATPDMHLLAVDSQAVVLAGTQAWILDSPADWREMHSELDGRVAGVVGDGRQSIAILQSGGRESTRIAGGIIVADDTLSNRPLPPLPVGLHAIRGAIKSDSILVHGEDEEGVRHLLSLPAAKDSTEWDLLPLWDDRHGSLVVLVPQEEAPYAVTESPDGGGQHLLRLTDGKRWEEMPPPPGHVLAGAARPEGQSHILFALADEQGTRIATFHSITRRWAELGEVSAHPFEMGMPLGKGLLLARTAGGSSRFTFVELAPAQLLLKPLDWAVIVLYLAGIAGIASWCYWRERNHLTSAEFFVGDRVIPFWAAAISLYATNSSSIAFIATTAKAFATNWQNFLNNLVGVLGLVYVAFWIVPMLRKLEMMSVFQYLEQRFHPSVRLAASALSITMHLGGRMSVILFLPSMAISTVTGMNVVSSILIMGVVTILYTALGGMKAVIWTDVAQLFVMFGGMLFAIVFILSRLDGGLAEFVSIAAADDKMRLLDWSFDLTRATVWGITFLVIMEVVLTFPKDQVLMQRVFTTKSERDATRSVWMFAALIIPGSTLFYLIGTALYVFYHSHPERMNPTLRVDATFPLFIAAELPVGVTGLIIAGIFAASMSTLSSILNSVATLVSVDFYERFARSPGALSSVVLAKWVTVIAGVIGVSLALLLTRFNINSFFDIAVEFAGLFGGAFGGAFTLGMFTRRANWQGVLIGMLASIALTFVAWSVNLVHPLLYLAVAILVSIVAGWIGSLFFPAPSDRSLRGLTLFKHPGNLTSTAA